jgi:iron complex transport system substrate-binding protein
LLARRPTVFFEEWYDPLISGIRWTEELIEIAGGQPIFPELARASLAKDRIVSSEQVIERAPEVIIGSWCGKPVRKERIASRPGWQDVPAVRNGQIYEVKSTYILQPGPAALTEGASQLRDIIEGAANTIAG